MNQKKTLSLVSMMIIRSYSELLQYDTFEGRYEYLKLTGAVGHATFGFDRHINQAFYNSQYWEDVRRDVIIRDNGCDLGILGYEIGAEPLVHHMNPITSDDILHRAEGILDPEYLILTTHRTHNEIHFGKASSSPRVVTRRAPRDTIPW